MNKVLVILLFATMTGCDAGIEDKQDENVQVETAKIDKANACAEILSTRVFESSKRMDILKFYGFTPVQAQAIEVVMRVNNTVIGNVSELKSMNNSIADSHAERFQNCLNEHGLSCVQALTHAENGETEIDFMIRRVALMKCTENP